MTSKRNLNVAKWLVGSALVLVGSSAMADWTFANSTTAALTGTTITAVATAMSNNGAGSAFANATATPYGASYGLGVTASGESTASPDHSTDNVGSTDAILLTFSSSVVLTGITSGWTWKDDTLSQDTANGETLAQFNARKALQTASDSDVSVLRYIGAVSTAAAVTASTIGKTVQQMTAAGGGWALVSQLANVVSDVSTSTGNTTQGSSWWLVSAYNSGYASVAGSTYSSAANLLNDGNDYFKLLAVAGVATPTGRVPEPGSLALVGAGLLGFLASRRKAKGETAALAA
ncbi:hypothetical protein os1_09130 [Comamonadaceae bacterium OS-1]|nr:hypothetical protein os1_09130 [Comamonadaceae bacterium OS-1]